MAQSGGRLHVFDMDGTLLKGASTVELARHFNGLDRGLEIEARWLAGEIDEREFWEVLLEICGKPTEQELEAAFRGSNWMTGVAETFQAIRASGEIAIVISQSPIFFVRGLQSWGAHEAFGTPIEFGEPFSDDVTLTPEQKVTITQEALGRYELEPEQCVAYGDSSSDIDLFQWLPHTVAVNPNPVIAELASVSYIGDDIREALALGRRVLEDASRTR